MKDTIGFIGCGNMAQAMIGGVVSSGLFTGEQIIAYDPSEAQRQKVAEKFGIQTAESNIGVASGADYLVLAVKPFVYADVLREIAGHTKDILGKDTKVIRTQPSTPAFVGESDSTVCPDELMTEQDIEEVMTIFKSFGRVEIISEKLMNVVPSIASSAPAYTMLLIEAMADGGVLHGFPRDQAYRLAAQSVYGAAKLVLETGEHPAVLKDQICTPGGTTIEAVRALEASGFRDAVISAVDACALKSISLLKK